MYNEFYRAYQYDSCVSKGICSINPRISSLQTAVVLYLSLFAKYALNLEIDKKIKNFILNTISITIYNPEFNENSFLFAIKKFKEELPQIMDKFFEAHTDVDMNTEKENVIKLFEQTSDIIQAIKYGEKAFNKAQEKLTTEKRDIYNIMLVLAKSLSINLLELNSFDKDDEKAFSTILDLLNNINLEGQSLKALKELLYESANIDNNLMKCIKEAQEERYGKQGVAEVSYSTEKGKAVLVVGSNIRELEIVLEALIEEDIDVYTHDDMMLAHTFLKFLTYPNLKGQFGQGLENCLLDFATFPGPIILTKNSLHNIENFYRGRLFTTDYTTSPKGIVKIENNDFSPVIESAIKSKGFKTGRICESITIGFNYEEITNKIKTSIESNNYEQIFVIAPDDYNVEYQSYFHKLIKNTPKNVLIISFSHNSKTENLIHINTCFDNYSWIKITEFLENFGLPITIFVPKCERNTISQIISFSKKQKIQIFIGKCIPMLLNPSLMNTFKKEFSIKKFTNSKNDLEEIFKDNI